MIKAKYQIRLSDFYSDGNKINQTILIFKNIDLVQEIFYTTTYQAAYLNITDYFK